LTCKTGTDELVYVDCNNNATLNDITITNCDWAYPTNTDYNYYYSVYVYSYEFASLSNIHISNVNGTTNGIYVYADIFEKKRSVDDGAPLAARDPYPAYDGTITLNNIVLKGVSGSYEYGVIYAYAISQIIADGIYISDSPQYCDTDYSCCTSISLFLQSAVVSCGPCRPDLVAVRKRHAGSSAVQRRTACCRW
jgi:hypothetical protein